jgi:hypothetical protein
VENIRLNNTDGWRNKKKKDISIEHYSLEKLRDGFSQKFEGASNHR